MARDHLIKDFISAQVAEQRRNLGLTQAELGRRAGVSRQAVNQLENGKVGSVSFDRVLAMMNEVGLSLHIQIGVPYTGNKPAMNPTPAEDEEWFVEWKRKYGYTH